MHYVSEGGANSADNLLPLCPLCHALHHNGTIPTESLRAWKMLMIALNEAFDRRSIDLLLLIAELKYIDWITGDGLPPYSDLAASNLISIKENWCKTSGSGRGDTHQRLYRAAITEAGGFFVEGWKKGDQHAAIALRPPPD